MSKTTTLKEFQSRLEQSSSFLRGHQPFQRSLWTYCLLRGTPTPSYVRTYATGRDGIHGWDRAIRTFGELHGLPLTRKRFRNEITTDFPIDLKSSELTKDQIEWFRAQVKWTQERAEERKAFDALLDQKLEELEARQAEEEVTGQAQDLLYRIRKLCSDLMIDLPSVSLSERLASSYIRDVIESLSLEKYLTSMAMGVDSVMFTDSSTAQVIVVLANIQPVYDLVGKEFEYEAGDCKVLGALVRGESVRSKSPRLILEFSDIRVHVGDDDD